MHKVTIRAAMLSDANEVFRLLCKFATSYKPSHATFDSNYAKLLENEGSDLLVADEDGAVAGYALASDSLTLFANGVVTELIELYVEEERRGSGIGQALVRQACSRARDRGAVEITVPTRRARSFYLTLGFEFTAEFFKLNLEH